MVDLHQADTQFAIGLAITLAKGHDVTFLAIGETVAPAFQASQMLAEPGIAAGVLSVHSLKPLDEKPFSPAATVPGYHHRGRA